MKTKLIVLFSFFSVFYSVAHESRSSSHISEVSDNTNIPIEQAIVAMGFEKTLTSEKETFFIQNRTSHLVTRIKLRLVYKTPQGQILDYRDIVLDEEILPTMTKKFSIKSFDLDQQYYYYTTPPRGERIETSYPFKVSVTILRYDIAVTQ